MTTSKEEKDASGMAQFLAVCRWLETTEQCMFCGLHWALIPEISNRRDFDGLTDHVIKSHMGRR